MRRRELMLLLGAAAATRPLATQAQQAKVYRLGILTNTRRPGPSDELFRGLRDLGSWTGKT